MERELSVDELAFALERGEMVVLDVRDGPAFAAGHIPGSWPVALSGLPARLRDPDDALWQRLFAGSLGLLGRRMVAGGA